MSLLPSRPVQFGRPQAQNNYFQQQQQQQQQAQQHAQQQQAQVTAPSLALPSGPNISLPGPSSLALPGYAQPSHSQMPPPPFPLKTQPQQTNGAATAGPSASSPPASAVPSTPAPLTLEQQHITAVDGIVPTLQNIVATVNLDCRLDLKTIALHARNAEYNPKVSFSTRYCRVLALPLYAPSSAFRSRYHAYPRTEDDCTHLRIGQDGRHGC